ncbi:MAG: protein kinase [Acidobacteria bacterium]|nr:protein kinase [Acidobacteriota bacterium]
MIGESLGPYKILEPLGAGGMGEVYLAEDTRLDRKVAIKVLPEEFAGDPQRVARFEREARAAAALNHPHIATIHDVGHEGDTHFIVQEYLVGEPLARRLDRGVPPATETLRLAMEIAEALAAAHEAGVVHRDLKPGNVFITEEGDAKILDFGLARLESDELTADCDTVADEPVTRPGMLLGTLEYMSPEQTRSEPADTRSDIFAFGCLLYEMVTGECAFARPSAADTIAAILKEEPPRLEAAFPAFAGGELRSIVRHCLEKRPENRFQSARDLTFALSLVGCGTPPAAETVQSNSTPSGEGRATGQARSVGVAPFVALGSDRETEQFAAGLAEEIVSALSTIRGLHVAAGPSSSAASGEQDVREVGRELGVDTILRGSVRRARDRVRVSVQLVNVGDGYHRWTQSFEHQFDDVFAIQEEIASAIAAKIERRDVRVVASGTLKGIAYRPRDGEGMRETDRCRVRIGRGLERENRPGGRREVTLLSEEAWRDTCAELGVEMPWHTRRANLLIQGFDLAEAISHTLRIGEVEIRIHGETNPCDFMDEQHFGLREALISNCRGGVYGQVLVEGTIHAGDPVTVLEE